MMTDKEMLRHAKRLVKGRLSAILEDEMRDFTEKIGRVEARTWIKKNQRQLAQLVLKEVLERTKQQAEYCVKQSVKRLRVDW